MISTLRVGLQNFLYALPFALANSVILGSFNIHDLSYIEHAFCIHAQLQPSLNEKVNRPIEFRGRVVRLYIPRSKEGERSS